MRNVSAARGKRTAIAAAAALSLLPLGVRSTPLEVALSVLLAVVLAALSVIDLEEFRLPDVLTLPLIVAGICLVPPHATIDFATRALAAGLGYVLLAGVGKGYQLWRGHAGLGLGDAKLYAGAGAWVSLSGLAQVLLLAALAALAVVAVAALRSKAVDRQQAIAFGPYLATGFWTTWVFGELL